MKRVLLFKEKNNENPALLWKNSSYSSRASPFARSRRPPAFPVSWRPHLEQRLVPRGTELMQQAAGQPGPSSCF